MMTLLVNAGGLALMAAIIWWFWLSSPAAGATRNDHTDHH